MKHFLTLAALFVMTFTAVAQPPMGQGPRGRDLPPEGLRFEQQDPEQVAQRETEQLDKLVSLTPKQFKKIKKFNRRQAEERQSEMESFRPQGFPAGGPDGMGPGMGGGRPPMGQGRPDSMGPGGRAPRDGQFRPGPNMQNESMKELMEEQQAKKVKKYRKVLTPEQFQKWESFEAQREFRQMIETPEK